MILRSFILPEVSGLGFAAPGFIPAAPSLLLPMLVIGADAGYIDAFSFEGFYHV